MMDFNEVIKNFFRSENSDSNNKRKEHHSRFDDFIPGFPTDKSMDEMFRHFHGGMEEQRDAMQKHIDEMMKNFGVVEFSSPDFNMPALERKPWDEMLKEPEHRPDSDDNESRAPALRPPPSFKGFFSFPSVLPRVSPKDKIDTDLDGKIDENNVVDIFKNIETRLPPVDEKQSEQPGVFSSHRSVSVSTVQGPDGKVEHKKSVRDSSGGEETTITRSIGDKTHTVVTKTDDQGVKETIENYQNMDEGDLSDFNEKWQSPSDPRSAIIKPGHTERPQSIFSKFFGINWKDS